MLCITLVTEIKGCVESAFKSSSTVTFHASAERQTVICPIRGTRLLREDRTPHRFLLWRLMKHELMCELLLSCCKSMRFKEISSTKQISKSPNPSRPRRTEGNKNTSFFIRRVGSLTAAASVFTRIDTGKREGFLFRLN